jgi:hypothetical protein
VLLEGAVEEEEQEELEEEPEEIARASNKGGFE